MIFKPKNCKKSLWQCCKPTHNKTLPISEEHSNLSKTSPNFLVKDGPFNKYELREIPFTVLALQLCTTLNGVVKESFNTQWCGI